MSSWEQPTEQIVGALLLKNFIVQHSVGWTITNSLIATLTLERGHLSFTLFKQIFKDVGVASVQLLVFDYATGEEHIESSVLDDREVLLERISFGQAMSLNLRRGLLSVPSKNYILELLA